MRVGKPDDGLASFLDRVEHPQDVSHNIQEMLTPYLPKLPYRPEMIDWDQVAFGPGSFSNEHKQTPSTISKDVRLIWSFARSCSYSKVASVPKNFKTNRLIAAEPLEHQLRQYPIARALMRETEYRSFGAIRYHDQNNNRSSCIRMYATADQSNASDNVQLDHIKHTMPEWWPLLRQFRTSLFIIKRDDKPKSLDPIFATMGSFLTFPCESWVFYAYTYAILKLCGASRAELRAIRVYGDDVIIPREYYPVWKYFMEFLGFQINGTKSFWMADEPFRETCGVETYDDVDITPYRMPRSTTLEWYREMTFPQLIDMINNMNDHEAYITAHLLISEMIASARCNAGSGFWAERRDAEHLRRLMLGVGINDTEAEISVDDVVDLQTVEGHGHFTRISASWRPLTVSASMFYSQHHLFWRRYNQLRMNRCPIAPSVISSNPQIRWENKHPSFFELAEPSRASMAIRHNAQYEKAIRNYKITHNGALDGWDKDLIDLYSIIDITPVAPWEDYSEEAVKRFYLKQKSLRRYYARKLF
jgi:hypothetical protein